MVDIDIRRIQEQPIDPMDILLKRAEQMVEYLDAIRRGSVQRENLRAAIEAVRQ